MKTVFISILIFSQLSYAGWSVFQNRPNGEKPFTGACMNVGTFLKFSATMLEVSGCKLDTENTQAVICNDNSGSSTSTWFETQQECNTFRKTLMTSAEQPKKKKTP